MEYKINEKNPKIFNFFLNQKIQNNLKIKKNLIKSKKKSKIFFKKSENS